jgi:type IV fimbrial biogenesis protein FimT
MLGMKKSNGFTLTELMVTLAIIAIIATLSGPSFSDMIKNNRLTTQANEFITDLNVTRSEAVKRGTPVIMCRSINTTTCDTDGSRAKQWESGWLVFVDINGDTNVDANEILRVHNKLSGNNSLRSNTLIQHEITYQPTGRVAQAGSLALCDDRNGDGDKLDAEDFNAGRGVVIATTGRARAVKDPGTNTTTLTSCEP